MAEPLDEDDEGLAPERTALAWNRTGVAFLVAIAALGRKVWPLQQGEHALAVLMLGLAAIVFLASLWVSTRLSTHHRYAGGTMDQRAFQLVTAGTVAVAIAGFLLAFTPS